MDILTKIRAELPDLPKKLAMAARYALEHPDRIALNSMRTSAAEVGVTSTTMLRLARQLGFESYDDFKAGFQAQLVATGFGQRAGALAQIRATGHGSELSQRFLRANEHNIRAALSEDNLREMSEVARRIREAPTVYLIGSGSIHWIAAFFNNTGSMILPNLRLVGSEFSTAAEAMGHLNARDVVIGFGLNPSATRTIDAMDHARGQGAHTVAVTDHPTSPLAQRADVTFYTGAQSPHYYPSVAAMIALIELLLATVVAEGGEEELERVRAMEAYRKASVAYLEY